MALKCNFNESKLASDIKHHSDELNERILASFIRAGLKFVKEARGQVQDHAMGTYVDQTTHLRNSIDFIVFHNGEMVRGSGSEFASSNLEKAREHVKEKGFQLICIAGMNYASYVESKGYNVISYQGDTCLVDLALYLEKLDAVKVGTAAQIEESFLP